MKRTFHASIFVFLLCLLAPLCESLAGDGSPKPNVLLLIIDDLNSWLLGDTNRYAGKVVAPNIRRLAESGVVFNRAYTAAPVCCLYAAPQPARGKPWLWYAPTLNGVSLVQRKLYFESFMRAGISIAGYDLGEVRGAPASTARFSQFYKEMVRRGWSAKPILLGQSRGGLMMLAWATRNPDKVRAFVGIYPVCNLASWPLEKSKAATLADFGMSEADLAGRFHEFNPVENLQGLAANKVPMFVVHGDSDIVVPYDDNARLLQERYETGGGVITVKTIVGEGHKVSPSFFECQELVAFVLANQ